MLRRLTIGIVAALGWAAATVAQGSATTAAETAALPADVVDAADGLALPRVLTEGDVGLYRRIFALQEDGDWKAADRLIATLGDRLLMGHVMAQRYLHPTKYRSRYKELKGWMAEYADHPDARRIYKLALRRKPRNWRSPKAPEPVYAPPARHASQTVSDKLPRKRLGREDRRRVASYKRQIRWNLRKGWTLAAKRLIRSKEVRKLFHPAELDWAKARLGFGYLVDGRDEWALKWAGEAAGRSGKWLPTAHWTAGLAAWRLSRFDEAARHFEAAADNPRLSPWMDSAAAFWAARSHLVGGRPQDVSDWLVRAAAHSRTFYGLLARRILGLSSTYQWSPPPVEQGAVTAVAATDRGRRAIALIRVGQDRRAERELRALAGRADPEVVRGILALASGAEMASLAVRLDERLFPDGGGYDFAAYPVPKWTPDKGFRVDRALIYALIRQESRFNPKAKSRAGARGLMQIMPGTASFVARDRGFRRGAKRRTLFAPKVNLELGQTYIEILLADDRIDGDLFRLATAWNGGPGNLGKWRRRMKDDSDPLLFIECIPSRETRDFIERVLTNLWIYRDRLGQPTPSLDALAAGRWPVYTALDGRTVVVAQNHGQDRGRAGVSAR